MILLLLGLKTDEEFIQALFEDGGLDEAAVSGIVQDLNQQLFIPIRQEMERGPVVGEVPVTPARAVPPPLPAERLMMPPDMRPVTPPAPVAPAEPILRPVGSPGVAEMRSEISEPVSLPKEKPFSASYMPENPPGYFAPPPQSPRYPNQESANLGAYLRAVPQARPQPRSINKLQANPTDHRPAPPTQPARPEPAPQPAYTRLVESSQLLEDHEESHIEVARTTQQNLPGALPAVAVPGSRSAPLYQAPRPAPSIAPIQSAPLIPQELSPQKAMPIRATTPANPAMPITPPHPAAPRSYSADPYREPIDPER